MNDFITKISDDPELYRVDSGSGYVLVTGRAGMKNIYRAFREHLDKELGGSSKSK